MKSESMRVFIANVLLFMCFVAIVLSKEDDEQKKEVMINEIMKQVNIITREVLSKVDKDKKHSAIQEIERKVRQIATAFGPDSESLVQIIMKGVRTNAFHGSSSMPANKKQLRYDSTSDENDDTPDTTNATVNNTTDGITTSNKTKIRNHLINDFALKIQLLAKIYFNDTQTIEEKNKVVEIITNKLLQSDKDKDNNPSRNKSDADFITKGVSIAAFRAQDEPSSTTTESIDPIKNNTTNEPQVNMDDYTEIDEHIDLLEKYIEFDQSYCESVVKDVCTDIKSLDILKCTQDGSEVAITNLCNGVDDCPDRTDELNCIQTVIARVRSARNILRIIEAPNITLCFTALNSPSLLLENEQIMLRRLLNRQIAFVKQYANYLNSPSSLNGNEEIVDEETFLESINEVTAVIQTLSSALNGFVCLNEELSEKDKWAQISPLQVDELDQEINKVPTWSPKYCKCKEQHCISKTCDNNCKRVCWQKYALARWSCQAVNGQMTVPIDVICDGKLDCFDESDETDCSSGQQSLLKIDAIKTYESILDQIEERAHKYSLDFPTRNALLALHTSVKKLQHIGTKKSPDKSQVKIIRDQCFSNLKAVFEEIRRRAAFVEEVDTANIFMMSINKMLVKALKYTHSGNDRLVAPDGCYCRGTKCVLPVCTKKCARVCSAETALTKYPCDEKNNITITVENICNGKENCPNGEDEQCEKNEICRAHHLILLRHKLKNVGLKENGVMGEMIKGWKEKATSKLMIAESNGRPTPRAMKDIIHDLLQDLLSTYATLDEYRKNIALNQNIILDKFIGVSRIVMDSLKSCGI